MACQVAWLHGLMDFVFPYLVQFLKEYTGKVDLLMEDRRELVAQRSAMENAHKDQQVLLV